MAASSPELGTDQSWVSVDTALDLAAMREFCADLERLMRINPYLEFDRWRREGNGRHQVRFRNLSNERSLELELCEERLSPDKFSVSYSDGIKARTQFRLERTNGGCRLTITDDYSRLPPAERELRLAEVDRSLQAWGWALHGYLRLEARWGRFGAWRWYRRRIWLPMKPSARRITFMLLVVTIAEMVIVAFAALIYWIEFAD